MAQRRMFSKKIINSARFLKMPVSTQCLYFHLGLNADDEGVTEAFNIMRMIGSTEDDLKILVVKEFAIVLNEDLVTYIVHWNEHNLIRADRMVDSMYKNLLIKLSSVEYLEGDVSYENESKMTTKSQANDSIGKVRLGKDRLGKDRLGKDIYKERVKLSKEEYGKLLEKYKDEGLLDKGIEILNNYIQAKEPKYKSHYHVMIAWVYERVMEDEKSKGHRHERDPAKDRTTEGIVKDGGVSKYTSKNYL